MSSQYIFYTKISVNESNINEAWELWKKQSDCILLDTMERRCFYQEDKINQFIELISIESLSDVEDLIKDRYSMLEPIKDLITSDLHQQVFSLVESVKPSTNKLPVCEKLQLRYIEVPLSVKGNYLEWREDTIFDVVRNADEVKYFQAYNTILSTQPGVMFFSEYEGDTEHYMDAVFRTNRYKEIVKDAGDKYISGGVDGLYLISYIGE